MGEVQVNPLKTTYRYCGQCDEITTFKYERIQSHSVCKKCGWRLIPTLITDWRTFKQAERKAWELWDATIKAVDYEPDREKRRGR